MYGTVCAHEEEEISGKDWGESRRALRNGMGQRDRKFASHCMLLGDKERRRMENARPKGDKQRVTKS